VAKPKNKKTTKTATQNGSIEAMESKRDKIVTQKAACRSSKERFGDNVDNKQPNQKSNLEYSLRSKHRDLRSPSTLYKHFQWLRSAHKKAVKLGLVIASGVATSLALPPYGIEGLAWVCLAPMMYICWKEDNWKGGFKYGLIYGVVLLLTMSLWVANVTIIGWLVSTWLSIFPAAFGAIIAGRNLGAVTPLWWGSAWITIEGIKTTLRPFGWNPTASLTNELTILVNAAWGGQWVVGLALATVSGTIAYCTGVKKTKERVNSLLLCLVFLAPLYTLGSEKLARDILKENVHMNIVTNEVPFTPCLEKRWEILDKNIKLTETEKSENITIWPESIGFVLLGHQAVWDRVREMCSKVPGPILLTPSYPQGDKIYNSSILLEKEGTEAQIYKKRHLTPLGEHIPEFIAQRLRVGKRMPGDDKENSTLLVENSGEDRPYRIGMLICLEETMSDAAHRRVRDGAELLVSPSNHGDTGFGCAQQQESMGRLRAIETGKTLVRVGNMGGSSVYDGLGKKVWSTKTAGIDRVEIPILKLENPHGELKQTLTYLIVALGFIVGLWFANYNKGSWRKELTSSPL